MIAEKETRLGQVIGALLWVAMWAVILIGLAVGFSNSPPAQVKPCVQGQDLAPGQSCEITIGIDQ